MQRTIKSVWAWAVVACIVAMVAVVIMPSMAHAEPRTVDLQASMTGISGGSVDVATAEVSDEGILGELPNPTPPAGWAFAGWYTSQVQTTWWKSDNYSPFDASGKNLQLPAGFESLKDVRSGGGSFNENDYWSYIVGTAGDKVSAGQKIDNTVSMLYAAYTPTRITVKFYWNGWNNQWGCLIVSRDYGTSTSGLNPSWDGKHTLTGWQELDGTSFNVDAELTRNYEVYAQWTGPDGTHNDGNKKNQAGSITGLIIGPKSVRIDPDHRSADITATVVSSNQFSTGVKDVVWKVSGDAVDFAPMGLTCRVGSKGFEGTAIVTASITDVDGKTYTDSATVKVAHSFDGKTVVTKYPTCTEDGEGYTFCSDCNKKLPVHWEKKGHSFTWHTTDSTCTKPGCTERICRECGLHETETTIPAKGHTMQVKTISSCGGTTTIKTCGVCGETETVSDSSQVTHEWEPTKTVDKEPTCKDEGSKSTHCKNCEVTKDSEVIPATGNHTWDQWKQTKAPTLESSGMKEHTCTICGLTEQEEVAHLIEKADKETTETPRPAMSFADVKKGDWYYDSVSWAYQQGIFSGIGNTNTFQPDGTLTRAQAAIVLYNWFGTNSPVMTAPFSDVSGSAYYAQAVNWAYSVGIFKGYGSSNRFGAEDALTREQMCVVLQRASEMYNGVTSGNSGVSLESMPDSSAVAPYMVEGVEWAIDHGVMKGAEKDGARYILPANAINRAEMATLMMNAINADLL